VLNNTAIKGLGIKLRPKTLTIRCILEHQTKECEMRYEIAITVWVDADSEEEAENKIESLIEKADEIDSKNSSLYTIVNAFIPYKR